MKFPFTILYVAVVGATVEQAVEIANLKAVEPVAVKTATPLTQAHRFIQDAPPAATKRLPLKLIASYERFDDRGLIAADGKRFDPNLMTCATRLFPLGSMIRVTDSHNRLSVVVRVTDRPHKRFAGTRIDLSPRAFRALNGLELGIFEIEVEKL